MNPWLRYLREHNLELTHVIIGVDPGDTTGIFVCIVHTRGVLLDMHQVNAEAVYYWMQMLITVLDDCGVPDDRRHVAIEKYQITQRTVKLTRKPAAIEVTGVVKAVASEWGAQVWEFGMATTKKFASNDALERTGWVPRKMRRELRHAADAARQAWTCLSEVHFPTWEANWTGDGEVTLSGDSNLSSLAKMIIDMGGLSDNEER